MVGGHVWQGACVEGGMPGGGMCGRGNAWQGTYMGACMARGVWQGGMCGRGCAWQGGMHGRGMCGRGHAWQGKGVHGRGCMAGDACREACMVGGMHGSR